MAFDAKKVKDEIVQWIRDWFEVNGKGCKAVVGLSGGKDSSVVAALCAEALGKENVLGVMMPNGEQFDIDVSIALAEHVGIESVTVNIKDAYEGIVNQLTPYFDNFEGQAKVNLPPRLRMASLYAVSQSVNGRVANTCNLSEDWVGYATKFGDGAGDFSPLSKLTVQDIFQHCSHCMNNQSHPHLKCNPLAWNFPGHFPNTLLCSLLCTCPCLQGRHSLCFCPTVTCLQQTLFLLQQL